MKRTLGAKARSVTRLLALLVSLVVGAALMTSCGQPASPSGRNAPSSTTGTLIPGGGEPQTARNARGVAYFLTKDSKVVPVRVDAAATDTEGVANALFAGATREAKDAGYGSAIPPDTRLLSLSVETSTAVADLSAEFASGGGSLSMRARVAQVVFTLTRDPSVTKVVLKIEGKPITALGGEGLVLTTPQTRADWEELSPAILIESPVLDDTVSGNYLASGTANVFEGQFRLSMLDSGGAIRTTQKVTATSGTGTRGSFVATVTASYVPKGPGSLIGFYVSAKSDSRVVSMKVPLKVE